MEKRKLRRVGVGFFALAVVILLAMVALLPTGAAAEAYKRLVPAFVFSVLAGFLLEVYSQG